MTARLGRIAWVANKSTSVRKPITPINSDRAGESAGRGGAIMELLAWFIMVPRTKGVPPRGEGGTPRVPARERGSRRGSGLLGGFDVRRQQHRRSVAVVDPIMADAIRLAGELAGVMGDRHRATAAIF